MLHYVTVLDETTGSVVVYGNPDPELIEELNLVLRDVEESEIGGGWYLSELCPHYTPAQLQIQEKEREIEELKEALKNSDYKAIKYAEGELTEEEYSPSREERRGIRVRINELEAEIKSLQQ